MKGSRVLGTEPEIGFYRFRAAKKACWQYCHIMVENGLWVVLTNGEVVAGSGVADPFDIPFLQYRWGYLHPIEEVEYDALIREYDSAEPGSPLRTPGEKVDLRSAPPLYRGKS
jgi:hypothetical protein